MTQKTIWWILGIVIVVLLGLWAWNVRPDDAGTDMATTTASTTPEVIDVGASGAGSGAQPAGTQTGGVQAPGNLPNGGYTIDTEASVVRWTGTKPRVLGYEDTGTVQLKSGTLKVGDGNVISGDFYIDMDSIAVTKTSNTKAGGDRLVSHLKSDDFFGVEKYPNAHFVIKNVTNGTVTGDLTIKSTTKTISFPAAIRAESETRLRAQAAIVLNRATWDIRYGSGSFFQDLGDNLIADTVQLDLDLVATK
jgi:polyisoprenoid-binding protein YceI